MILATQVTSEIAPAGLVAQCRSQAIVNRRSQTGGQRGVVVEARAARSRTGPVLAETAIVSVAPCACSVCESSLAKAVSSGRIGAAPASKSTLMPS